jgi:hypothetical protein
VTIDASTVRSPAPMQSASRTSEPTPRVIERASRNAIPTAATKATEISASASVRPEG